MPDSDHDKIIRMEEKVNSIGSKLNELSDKFDIFKTEYRKGHEDFRKEVLDAISKGMNDAKQSAVKYADNAVISSLRDKGEEMFAEKRVQTVVYATIKVMLYAVLGAILTAAGFLGFQSYGG